MPPGKVAKVCKDCWAEYTEALDAWWKKLESISSQTLRDLYEKQTPRPKLPKRDATKPGPRCVTHWRKVHKQQKERAHETRTTRIYGIEPGEYGQILAYQGGTCAIPRCPARGVVKRLAVDHNHTTGAVRGLLCGPHNRLIGASFDDPTVFEAIAEYLRHPPYERMKHGEPKPNSPSTTTQATHDRHLETSTRNPTRPSDDR